jgi:ribosomal subunit interface protein
MQIPINPKGTNLPLEPHIISYLEKRLEQVGKLIPEDSSLLCDVELAKTTDHHEKGDVYYAEINLTVDGKLFRATAEAETIEAAIDIMQSNVMRLLRKTKRKGLYNIRKGGAMVKDFLRGLKRGR